MQTKTMLHLLGASLLSAVLASCGGGSGSSALNGSGGDGSGNAPAWLMGSGSGGGFNTGVLGVKYKSGLSNLYVGDSALISVSVVDGALRALATSDVSVTFSSPCLDSGKSRMVGGKVVSVKGGQATLEYVPETCVGEDVVKAVASYRGVALSATKSIPVRSIQLGVGAGVDFIPTKLGLDANAQALFTNQTTNLNVNLINDLGGFVEIPFPVTFSSECLDAKPSRSMITGGSVRNSLGGVAKAEYKVGDCFGDDTVTATITYAGKPVSASAVLPQVNNRRIGSGTGAGFVEGAIAVGSTNTVFFEGDIVPLTVSLVDNQGVLVAQSTPVTFDSPCISDGRANIGASKVVNSVSGQATVQYKVGKCSGDDKVTAVITNGSQPVEAVVQLALDNRRMGSGFGESYIDGALEFGVGTGVLSPGASTAITAYIVNSRGELAPDAVSVTFSSPCLSADNASIEGGNTVAAVNGKAIATYTSKGCAGVGGFDAIKATATFRKTVLNASAQLAVKADTAQTIMFVDAKPSLISIKGTGGAETSIVRFKVLGQGGSPLKGVCVNFSSSTNVGGLALVPSKCNPAGAETYGATSDVNGFVSTTVQAGTVATPVRITATTANGLSTQSSALAVTTGIPDQNSFSLSVSKYAPIGWHYDGETTTASVRLADAFNNPVPDNTVITFTTSGGSIKASCPTVNGQCSVEWQSQNPRPLFSPPQVSFGNTYPFTMSCPSVVDSGGHTIPECRSGRVQILATAIGNESFIDGNGNGLYDDPLVDIFATHNLSNGSDLNAAACSPVTPRSSASVGATVGCDDLGEAYLDKDENEFRSKVEEFADFNQNALFDANNGKYDGALCSGGAKSSGACTTNKVSIRTSATIVMSCEEPFEQGGTLPGLPLVSNSVAMIQGQVKSIAFLVADCNGNGMPAGTKLSVNTADLKNASVTVTPDQGFPDSTEPGTAYITITAAEDKVPVGVLSINVTAPTPNGSKTTVYGVRVN